MAELDLLLRCLDALESREAALLAWGDSGSQFSQTELIDIIARTVPDQPPATLLAALLAHAMVLPAPAVNRQTGYRTRMGEAVHLYRNLRQWMHHQSMGHARTLVSDFRFVRRPRSYPARSISAQQMQQWLLDDAAQPLVQDTVAALQGAFQLAAFQARSTRRVLTHWSRHQHPQTQPSGTIVCAGTGSGKTLAFYLPALAALVDELSRDSTARVRILAIYPRKELLKDQFMETWQQCRKLDASMLTQARRKIRMGAFFGDTPHSSARELRNGKAQDRVVDLLRCPNTRCQGQMQWQLADLQQAQERLHCSDCSHTVGADEVLLSREAQRATPPDILFTTTEMLNQHLGNAYFNRLFGVGPGVSGPTLLLLDEVHTCTGTSGAQVAYLLRRWMKRSGACPHVVGLSATLADAEHFFAQLIGASRTEVELVEPRPEQMVDEGAEYLLALRGDPVSQTALLSTTIQASMLSRRILDNQQQRSRGVWGSRSFIFTDDLDVNNRLYHQLSDAEGWQTRYGGARPSGVPLACLRAPSGSHEEPAAKVAAGQDWQALMSIGHRLDEEDRACVTRTSSQDGGVNEGSELVVATASLEVGFNDPAVGVVIQHKAPRDVASYLQRKGRAGRSRHMRPWMLVILSEFGRDRVAFQRYEELVDPEVSRQGLPLRNGHIQKMQAAMATLDWLSMQGTFGALWNLLCRPERKPQTCAQLLAIVNEALHPGERQDSLFSYLQSALKLDNNSFQRALWSNPRSIMMAFLPELRRNLGTQWREAGVPWQGLPHGRSPMPAFIPAALFSELNLPELEVCLQRGPADRRKSTYEGLPFFQGMREFAPGRISKRYAVHSNYDADWLVPAGFTVSAGERVTTAFEVSDAFGHRILDEGQVTLMDGSECDVLRPEQVMTCPLDRTLSLTESSNSQLVWHSEFAVDPQTPWHTPPQGVWRRYLKGLRFCMHQQVMPLELVRYSSGAQASLRFRNGGDAQVSFQWVRNDVPVAVGARQWVDAACLQFTLGREVIEPLLKDDVQRSVRPLFFRQRVSRIEMLSNPFTANWIAECYLAALAFDAVLQPGWQVQQGVAALNTPQGQARLMAVPASLFQMDEATDEERQQLLQAELCRLLANGALLSELTRCAEVLWQPLADVPGLNDWLRQVLGDTLAAAAHQTLCLLLPDMSERAVLADAQWQGDNLTIWLSETEAGGSGVIAELNQLYLADPVRALAVFARCLQPGDYEQIDTDLYELLQQAVRPGDIQQAMSAVRQAENHQQRRDSGAQLRAVLQRSGFALSHSFSSVLYSRILRPASSILTDQQQLSLLQRWHELELQTGLEWPLNIAAYALAGDAEADAGQHYRRFCDCLGRLWPRGHAIRQSELNGWNPFNNHTAITERLLVQPLLAAHCFQVDSADADWLQRIHQLLKDEGQAELVTDRAGLAAVVSQITRLQLQPLDYLGLLLYPRLGAVERNQQQIRLRIELAEALQ